MNAVEKIGQCGIYAKLIKSSVSIQNVRIDTFEIQLPKVLLAELNTHRVTSKNTQSSRAIPVTKNNSIPSFAPIYYGANKSGMSSSGLIYQPEKAAEIWNRHIEQSKMVAADLNALNLHKQWANRVNDWHVMAKVIITATEWENFLWLRDEETAQPEMIELAQCIRYCIDNSVPEYLNPGEWHLPFINSLRVLGELKYFDSNGDELTLEDAQKISASCCCQISYRNFNDSKEKALEIYGRLFSGSRPHPSPCEHQGTPVDTGPDALLWAPGVTHMKRSGEQCSGNFNSWIQYRQLL
jgi:Thymidylate synthase complementing protein